MLEVLLSYLSFIRGREQGTGNREREESRVQGAEETRGRGDAEKEIQRNSPHHPISPSPHHPITPSPHLPSPQPLTKYPQYTNVVRKHFLR
ncbi:MAG TPA: hypothetical protein VK203_16375 [Nostocaceae cyanobacterium]|nr:hypothetical protein [Nostocaceae cyanobacterium]